MTARDDVDRRLTAWFAADAARQEPEYLLGSVLARTARTRRRPAWLIPERWIPMRTVSSVAVAAPRVPWRLIGAAALLILALVVGAALIAGNQQPRELPAPFGPAANGLVAYGADGDIYTVDPATGGPRAVITGSEIDLDPVWSRDGTHLVFRRQQPDGDTLFVAQANGSGVTQITPEKLTGIDSVGFSPDGREVMFTIGGVPPKIVIAEADGSGLRTLDLPVGATEPSYRPPDGAQIVFAGSGDEGGIYVVNPDGSGLRNLVVPARDASSGEPRWSPDGTQIAYALVDFTVPYWTVHTRVMSADGSGDRSLPMPADAKWNFDAVWSNDGERLAMQLGYSPSGSEDVVIAVVPADGRGTGVETDHFAGDPTLAWAPDDSSVLVMPNSASGPFRQHLLMDPTTGATREPTWTTTGESSWQRVAP